MGTYDAAAAKAAVKIRKYGGLLEVFAPEAVDPITGGGGGFTKVGEGYALVTEYSAYQVDGDKIRKSDRRLLVEASVALEEGQQVTVGADTYSVWRVEELKLDGSTRVFSKVQARR